MIAAAANAAQLELQDDQLVLSMIEMGRRAVAHLGGRSFDDFAGDPALVDAVSGCLLGVALAAGEVSEHLSNWLTDVPWGDLTSLASWRVHHIRTEENLRALFQTIERLPGVLASLECFEDPPTR
ncbi:MAG TPA: hypothetical protein VFS00_28145 [Polyangiaceae bacterium]|nr:hypothetical protein [Polyangiaceae bacterium]